MGDTSLHYRDMKKFLKNILLWNRGSDFEMISQKILLGWPFSENFCKILIHQ